MHPCKTEIALAAGAEGRDAGNEVKEIYEGAVELAACFCISISPFLMTPRLSLCTCAVHFLAVFCIFALLLPFPAGNGTYDRGAEGWDRAFTQ